MYYVYVLQSQFNKKIYIGFSSDLKRRISEHNYGRVITTRKWKPWKLVYYESYVSEELAKLRESSLKHFGSSYVGLMKRLQLK